MDCIVLEDVLLKPIETNMSRTRRESFIRMNIYFIYFLFFLVYLNPICPWTDLAYLPCTVLSPFPINQKLLLSERNHSSCQGKRYSGSPFLSFFIPRSRSLRPTCYPRDGLTGSTDWLGYRAINPNLSFPTRD
jgi:hypothetical protein